MSEPKYVTEGYVKHGVTVEPLTESERHEWVWPFPDRPAPVAARLDELRRSGLDGQGTEALAEVLRERSAGRVVLLASHDANLRDQFDQSITVARGADGSQVAA